MIEVRSKSGLDRGFWPTSPWRSRRRGVFPPRRQRRLEHDRRTAREVDKGHGRRERRTFVSTTILCGYLDWPGSAQAFRHTRERTVKGRTSVETSYGITSLPRDRADSRRLLGLVRRHGGIENKLHDVRDATLGEDACRVRKGSAPQVLAGVRNAALHLLKRINPKNVAAAIRRLAAKPLRAIRLARPQPEN